MYSKVTSNFISNPSYKDAEIIYNAPPLEIKFLMYLKLFY